MLSNYWGQRGHKLDQNWPQNVLLTKSEQREYKILKYYIVNGQKLLYLNGSDGRLRNSLMFA